MKTGYLYFFFLIIGASAIVSCQKEINGLTTTGGTVIPVPTDQKPRVGTAWTYSYYTFHANGGVFTSKTITHKAKSEETLGGEKWLKIVDMETDTTVYYLNTQTDGLYQYTNNNPYLLCKFPAVINDTYTTFNGGDVEDFKVLAVNDTTPTNIGDIPLSKYEGVKNTGFGTYIIDVLWYNKNAWLTWEYKYRKFPVAGGGILSIQQNDPYRYCLLTVFFNPLITCRF